ncbi:MAG: hypothetical protein ABIH34_05465 [Nanoarchaeota archaeon]
MANGFHDLPSLTIEIKNTSGGSVHRGGEITALRYFRRHLPSSYKGTSGEKGGQIRVYGPDIEKIKSALEGFNDEDQIKLIAAILEENIASRVDEPSPGIQQSPLTSREEYNEIFDLEGPPAYNEIIQAYTPIESVLEMAKQPQLEPATLWNFLMAEREEENMIYDQQRALVVELQREKTQRIQDKQNISGRGNYFQVCKALKAEESRREAMEKVRGHYSNLSLDDAIAAAENISGKEIPVTTISDGKKTSVHLPFIHNATGILTNEIRRRLNESLKEYEIKAIGQTTGNHMTYTSKKPDVDIAVMNVFERGTPLMRALNLKFKPEYINL